ncbi:protein kinase [Streptomyces sp. NPDC020983]|uniref:protein kinase domain-containing protein n=1 Tax=Streptomyces sp. NPDC020983 TaxID=3365106 RepID=UPI0037BDF152
MTEHGGSGTRDTGGEDTAGGGTDGAGGDFDLAGSGAAALKVEDPVRIGGIPLLGRLGSGGMGRVYLGLAGGEYAAVKQVHPHFAEDGMFLRRFGRELDNIARLPAGAGAPLLDSDRDARPPWFATAYIPGLTLSQAVELHGEPLPVPAVWLLLRHLAAGLRALGTRAMVHRDLKPSNVMLTAEGVTLIDFGIARAAEQSRLTGTGMAVGTPAYMSPEQAAATRQLTGATDVFALGSLVAYAATGRPPFGDGAGHEVLYRIVHAEPDLSPLRAVDGELADVVAGCLDKDPEARPGPQELLDLAARHAADPVPGWPPAVMARLDARAAFLARPRPDAAGLLAAARPATAVVPEPAPEDRAPAPGEEKRAAKPRRKVLLLVVPLVLAAGTPLTLQLLPDSSPGQAADGPRPPTASGSPTPGSPSALPAASTSVPATRAGTSPSATGPAKSAAPKAGSAAGASATSGSGGSSGTGGGTSGGSSGSSGGSGAASGSGGGSGTGSGGGTTASAKPPASGGSGSGYHAYKNGRTGTCLVANGFGNALQLGSCSGDAALWIQKAVGGGFQMVNKNTGECLQAGMFNNAATVAGCGSTGLQTWHDAAGAGIADGYDNRCLTVAYVGSSVAGIGTQSCDGSPVQAWRRQ